jgi:hypothetical protein
MTSSGEIHTREVIDNKCYVKSLPFQAAHPIAQQHDEMKYERPKMTAHMRAIFYGTYPR